MLEDFNQKCSKSYPCITVTVLDMGDLRNTLSRVMEKSAGRGVKDRSRVIRSVIDTIASSQGYCLKLRK